MGRTTQITEVSEAIERELTIYSSTVTAIIKKETQTIIKKLVKETKETAPVGKRNRHYRDSISSRKLDEKDRSVTYQWYVEGSNYRLSHLLENGHALRNGERYEGTGFIKKAYTPLIKEYAEKIEEAIRNG